MCLKIVLVNDILKWYSEHKSVLRQNVHLYSPLLMLYMVAIVILFWSERMSSGSGNVIQWVRSYARKGKVRFPKSLDSTAPPVGEKGMRPGLFCSAHSWQMGIGMIQWVQAQYRWQSSKVCTGTVWRWQCFPGSRSLLWFYSEIVSRQESSFSPLLLSPRKSVVLSCSGEICSSHAQTPQTSMCHSSHHRAD